jgi:anti-sigma factor RsiW
MYDCSSVMKLLHAHLDGELDVKESLRVQTHLQECPYCRENFVSEHAFQELVRHNASPPPAPEFARQCLSAALSREARRSGDLFGFPDTFSVSDFRRRDRSDLSSTGDTGRSPGPGS